MFEWYRLAIVIAEVARQSKTQWRSLMAVTFYAKLADDSLGSERSQVRVY